MVMLMSVGVVCAKLGLIDEASNKKLANIVLFLLGPTVMFLSYQRPFEAELAWQLLLTVGLATLTFGIAFALSHVVYARRKGHGVDIFASIYPNSGFIGIPLLQGIFGYESIFFSSIYMGVFVFFMWTHGVYVVGGGISMKQLRKTMTAAPMMSVFIGVSFFLLGIEVPEIVYAPMRLLANANVPMAMIAAGVIISGADIGRLIRNRRAYFACFMRLILIPLIMIFLFSFIEIPALVAGTIIVATACPSAVNLVFFAQRFDGDVNHAADTLALSTILSMATIPMVLMFI